MPGSNIGHGCLGFEGCLGFAWDLEIRVCWVSRPSKVAWRIERGKAERGILMAGGRREKDGDGRREELTYVVGI